MSQLTKISDATDGGKIAEATKEGVLEGVGGVLLTTQAISKTSKSKRIGVEEVDGE